LLEALNAFWDPLTGAHFILHCNYECMVCGLDNNDVCEVGLGQFKGVTVMWESLLCPKVDDAEFHCLKCLLGACNNCSVTFFKLCPREMEDVLDMNIKWKQF